MIKTIVGFEVLAIALFGHCCLAATVSNVTVESEANSSARPFDCVMQSSGAFVICQSGVALASGFAIAGFGGASVNIAVGGGPPGAADASADAGFDDFLVVNSLSGNTLIGHFAYSANCSGPFCFGNAYLDNAKVVIQGVVDPPLGSSPLSVQYTVQAGVPFDVNAMVSAFAETPGPEIVSASVQFTGFTDLSGNPVPYVVLSDVPEPSTLVLGAAAVLVLTLSRRLKFRPPFRRPSAAH